MKDFEIIQGKSEPQSHSVLRFCEHNFYKGDFEAFCGANGSRFQRSSRSTSRNLEKFTDQKDQNGFVEIMFTKPKVGEGFALKLLRDQKSDYARVYLVPLQRSIGVGL